MQSRLPEIHSVERPKQSMQTLNMSRSDEEMPVLGKFDSKERLPQAYHSERSSPIRVSDNHGGKPKETISVVNHWQKMQLRKPHLPGVSASTTPRIGDRILAGSGNETQPNASQYLSGARRAELEQAANPTPIKGQNSREGPSSIPQRRKSQNLANDVHAARMQELLKRAQPLKEALGNVDFPPKS